MKKVHDASRSALLSSHLDNGLASDHLQDLAAPLGAVRQGQVNNLSIFGELVSKEIQHGFTTAARKLQL